jgi:hypothetical protein
MGRLRGTGWDRRAPDADPDSDEARRRLAQPLGGLLVIIAATFGAVFAFFLAALALGAGNVAFLGAGRGALCTAVPLNGVPVDMSGTVIAGLRPGVNTGAIGSLSVCIQSPSASQRWYAFLEHAPDALLYVAILLLVVRLLLIVRRDGPFVSRVPRMLRFLAWFVLIASVAATIVEGIGGGYLLRTITDQPVSVTSQAFAGSFLGVPLLAFCGLLTLARIMRVGARMRVDLEGTV